MARKKGTKPGTLERPPLNSPQRLSPFASPAESPRTLSPNISPQTLSPGTSTPKNFKKILKTKAEPMLHNPPVPNNSSSPRSRKRKNKEGFSISPLSKEEEEEDQPKLARYPSMPFLRQSLSDMTPINQSIAPPKESFLYKTTRILEYSGFLSILYISSLYLDTTTDAGKSLMFSITFCCASLALTDFYFSTRKLSSSLQTIDRVVWPGLFGVLYLLAGISLETGFGLFNELYIMLYCLFVTLTAFIFALRKNSMSLSVIAIIGGIAMPFIIEDAYDTSISVIYSCVVITSAVALYLYHGWAILLVVSSLAFWVTMHLHNILAVSRQDTDMIRGVIFFQWLGFWASTTIRERFLETKKKLSTSERARDLVFRQRKLIWFNLFILISCTHLLASTCLNIANWAPWGILKGSFYLFVSIGFAMWERKNPESSMSLFYPNYVVSLILLSAGIWLGLAGDDRYLALAVEACIVVLVSNHTSDPIGMLAGCLLWIYVLIWSVYVLIVTEPLFAVLNHEALLHLFIIAMLALLSHMLKILPLKLTFEGIVHALFNMWLYREFAHTENYLYFVTALYPAVVHIYAYFKGDSARITFIRMVFGDVLWLWLFVSQTLPRLLLMGNTGTLFPFCSLVGALDIFVIGLAFQSSLLQEQRFQGTTRWIYLVFCNATLVSLIYRDASKFAMVIPLLTTYTSITLLSGFYLDSSYLKLGAIMTASVLFLDDLLLGYNEDVLWKGTLALFAGITAVAIIFLPQNPDDREDPIEARARQLSLSGSFNLSKMSFVIPRSPVRKSVAKPSSQAWRSRSMRIPASSFPQLE